MGNHSEVTTEESRPDIEEEIVKGTQEFVEAQESESTKIVVSVNSRVVMNDGDEATDEFIEDLTDESVSSSDSDEHETDEDNNEEDDDNDENAEDEENDRVKSLDLKKVGCISCCTAFVLLIALAITVTAFFYHYYHLMDINDDDSIYYNDKVTFSDTEISEIPDGDVELEEGDVFKNKDVFNILLIGTDDRTKNFSQNARADSMMILSLDNKRKKIKLVSLERGMLVKIPGHNNDILTHTFRYGGSNLLMETVRIHFKVDVDKYIRVNFAMFQKLVDEVGGVDITLTELEAYGLNTYPNHNTWKLKRKVHEGINHFNGYEALQYSRLRWIDDDFHRIERQRKVIIAIKDNMTDLTVSDLKDISEDCLPYVQTNLSAVEFASLLINMPGYLGNDVEQMTIPKKGTYQTLGHVDFNENAKILKDFLYE